MPGKTTKEIAREGAIRTVHDFICKNPRSTIEQISTEVGYHYKTVSRYLSILRKDNRAKMDGYIDRQVAWTGIRESFIPFVPTNQGPIKAIHFASALGDFADKKAPFEQNTERFNYMVVALFTLALNYNEENKEAADKYLKSYRIQLEQRLALVNTLLSDDKFWVKEQLEAWAKDPNWGNGYAITKAWEAYKTQNQKELREEFKASLKKDPMAD